MPTTPLLTQLEQEIFFPVLKASPAQFPGRAHILVASQEKLIDVLRTMVYPCSTETSLHHVVALNRVAPGLRRVWTDLKSLGLPTLLEDTAHNLPLAA